MAKVLTKKNTLLMKIGTPAATDVVTTTNDVLILPDVESETYKDIGNGAQGNMKAYSNTDHTVTGFSADVLLRGSGAAGTAPKIAELFKMCGMGETIAAGVSVTYAPNSTSTTGTAKGYIDGSYREATGVVGSFKISGKIGEHAKASFDFKGFTTAAPTAEANPAVTLDGNTPLLITSATAITLGGAEIDIEDFELDIAAKIEEIYATTTKEFYIDDTEPTVKISAVKTKANETHWTDLNNNNIKALIITLGSGAGGTVTINVPYCNPKDVNEKDNSGAIFYEQTFQAQASSGNDNFSIVYS